MVGRFLHKGPAWEVHADSHYEPLLLALAAVEAGDDPFVEEDTADGRCLSLAPEVRAKQESPYKHMYIYSRSPGGEGGPASG